MSSNGQIPAQQVAGLTEALAGIATLVPLTTTDTAGEPALVWDENDELVLIEVSP